MCLGLKTDPVISTISTIVLFLAGKESTFILNEKSVTMALLQYDNLKINFCCRQALLTQFRAFI